MRGDFDEDETVDDDFDDSGDLFAVGCDRCGGEGFVVVCIDDMCRGIGECVHGDGEIACPDCCGKSAVRGRQGGD
jgi:hypothetical protein